MIIGKSLLQCRIRITEYLPPIVPRTSNVITTALHSKYGLNGSLNMI